MGLLYLYINDISNIKDISQPAVFADGTSTLVSKPSSTVFMHDINEVFININEWFKTNSLSLNFTKDVYN